MLKAIVVGFSRIDFKAKLTLLGYVCSVAYAMPGYTVLHAATERLSLRRRVCPSVFAIRY